MPAPSRLPASDPARPADRPPPPADPPEFDGADAEICWWVLDAMVGSDLEDVLEVAIPVWIANDWPLTRPRDIGRDLT